MDLSQSQKSSDTKKPFVINKDAKIINYELINDKPEEPKYVLNQTLENNI